MVTVLAWSATLAILATYAHLGVTGKPRPFDLANALGALVLVPVNLAAGVPAQAVLTAAFGIIGAVGFVLAGRRS